MPDLLKLFTKMSNPVIYRKMFADVRKMLFRSLCVLIDTLHERYQHFGDFFAILHLHKLIKPHQQKGVNYVFAFFAKPPDL